MATRRIHLIRHGQSLFNAAFDPATRTDPMLFDSPLSPRGRAQAEALRDEARGLGAELVVTSPLTRAIETTLAAFGPDHAPVLVEALHRERVEHSCDVGRSPAELAAAFPGLAFGHLDDPWWHSDGSHPRAIVVEPEPTLLARVAAFRVWLGARPERVIAVVGHGTFLNRLTGLEFRNCQRAAIEL
jgi:broad specificity phosphatase PhoE